MALADRRPLGIHVAAIPASPSFNPKTLTAHSTSNSATSIDIDSASKSLHFKDEDSINPMTPQNLESTRDLSPPELSPTLRSISPDSLMNNDPSLTTFKKTFSRGSTPPTTSSTPPSNPLSSGIKKPKNTSRAPIATGISTTIPVTGEKPRPEQKNDPSLEDDVLFAIFVILYEKDPEGAGMTVKQICDILVEQHPEMANLSTKTSNLVSAKLNAYVKRVEKGENNLKYALSRDWADASPKRMVYVYRGLLAEDFHVHVKKLMEQQKQDPENSSEFSQSPKSISSGATAFGTSGALTIDSDDCLEAGKHASMAKPRRQTMFDLGITKNTFLDTPIDKSNLFVPYSSAPVTASLTDKDKPNNRDDDLKADSDMEFEDFEVFNTDDDDEDEDLISGTGDLYIDSMKKNGKRSKSLSYLSLNKKFKVMTAAAAAPRVPKPTSNQSPNAAAAAAAAALHAAAIKAISSPSSAISSPNRKPGAAGSSSGNCHLNKKWLKVIRSGFLSQDIGTPEDISLSDLDKFFA